ncbi:MAG: hypothetical protein IJY92_04500 [Alphaproteobacteria bacterium]|nr:hypothetical protein [Alphaproteobacteria bacterium]
MLLEDKENAYKLKIQELGSCATKEEIAQKNLIAEIKDLLSQGVSVDTKDLTGYTLLHYLAFSKPIKELAEEGRSQNNFDNVLDIPSVVSWYKPNPFIKDSFGYTASFLAAYAEDTKAHQMLLSYESGYATARTSRAIESLVEMKIESSYVDGRGNIISLGSHQSKEFFQARARISRFAKQLRGDHIKD